MDFFFITVSSVLKGELLIFMATAMFDFPGVTVLRYQLFLVFCSICKVPFHFLLQLRMSGHFGK